MEGNTTRNTKEYQIQANTIEEYVQLLHGKKTIRKVCTCIDLVVHPFTLEN